MFIIKSKNPVTFDKLASAFVFSGATDAIFLDAFIDELYYYLDNDVYSVGNETKSIPDKSDMLMIQLYQ